MWSGPDTYINVTFSDNSAGRLAMVIYEFGDMNYLGKMTDTESDYPHITWVCTSDAMRAGLCQLDDLGKFIVVLPDGKSINDTSIWSASVGLGNDTAPETGTSDASSGFWNPPGGTPDLPSEATDDGPTNWRRQNVAPTFTYNKEPIHYRVTKKGYYCVGAVPVAYLANDMTIPSHATYKGTVLFKNKFHGQLPATDYPKIRFYLVITAAYLSIAGWWGYLCYKHKEDILPIQFYISSLFGLLVIEMLANWAYYRYLNAHGEGLSSVVFLIVVAILDAGRNALSFFLLLVVSLGLSVVREEIPLMKRATWLAIAHFVFGVMYAIAVVEIELEVVAITTLLFFVMPLSFTLTTFLLWIMYGLQGTMTELLARKQTYKLSMYRKLHYILIGAVLIILGFFVITSMSFSSRYEEDFLAGSWPYRWWLMDGYLTILFLIVFTAIAFLWRPTGNNRRLAMSTELAQDEDDADGRDAEAYDLEALAHGDHHKDDGEQEGGIRLPNADSSLHTPLAADDVVFEIGDHDDDDEVEHHSPRGQESHGLMGSTRTDKRID